MSSPISEIESIFHGETMWQDNNGVHYRCFPTNYGKFRVTHSGGSAMLWGTEIEASSPESAVIQYIANNQQA